MKTRIRVSRPKRSKFGVDQSAVGRLARTYEGRVYDSQAEMRYARHLDFLKKAKAIKEWIPQVRVPLVVNGHKICDMIPDFKVFMPDGSVKWIEVKGLETAVYKIKKKLFEALYRDEIYEVVKATDI